MTRKQQLKQKRKKQPRSRDSVEYELQELRRVNAEQRIHIMAMHSFIVALGEIGRLYTIDTIDKRTAEVVKQKFAELFPDDEEGLPDD